MKNTKPLFALALALAIPLATHAGVNLRNGDFFITYEDIALDSGNHSLTLSRTYNSLSTNKGWFGYGWGTPYETRLVVMPDGSVAVQRNGAAQIYHYRAKGSGNVNRVVDAIVDAATARDKLDAAAAEALRKSLLADEYLRVAKVVQYGVQATLSPGTVLPSAECSKGSVERTEGEYRQTGCNGETDNFDLKGLLLRHQERDGYVYSLRYTDNRPDSITDSLGQRIELTWTPTGFVAESSGGDKRTTYTYDERSNLASANMSSGLRYDYSYDGNHNLTRIGYVDDSSMRISYVSEDSGKVKLVVERSGDIAMYDYKADPQDPQRIATKVTRKSAGGDVETKTYEFRNDTNSTGETFLAGVAAGNGNNRIEEIYDDKNRLVRRLGADGNIDYIYHPVTGKLILVLNKEGRKEFHYDKDGDLVRAETSDGRSIELEYDKVKRISRMVDVNLADKARRELSFSYNDAGKPVEIRMKGVGKINVTYDARGEIESVVSNKGAKMALQVTQAFQELLNIVNVAGARMGM